MGNTKDLVGDRQRIDIQRWHREKVLEPGKVFIREWKNTEFRDDRRYRKLQIPLLPEDIRVDRHVLTLNRKFHGQRTNLNYLADIQHDRERDLVATLVGVPVNEHVR